MEQKTQYNSEDELIEWLKYDLEEQKKAIAKEIIKERRSVFLGKDISAGIEYNDIILNIGNKKGFFSDLENKVKTIINFNFSINNIFKKIGYSNDVINIVDVIIQCQNVCFNEEVNFNLSIFNKSVTFMSSTFNGHTFFSNSTFKKILSFSDCTFDIEANFMTSTFSEYAIFSNSTFNGVFKSLYLTFNAGVNFSSSTFNREVNFVNAIFNGKLNFSRSNFNGEANFSFSTFNGEASFNDVKFSSYTNVDSREKIESEISFKYIKIKDKLLLNNIELDNNEKSRIIFDELEFLNNNALLQIKNPKDTFKSMSFKDILINGRLDIQNIKTDNVDFLGSVVNGGVVNTINFTVDKFANRESALFLKHQAYIMHNNIEALRYKAKEMEMHMEELKKIEKRTCENMAEILSMFLSKVSNNHGQNWFQAIFFTVLIPTLFFAIFYFPTLNLIFKMPCSYYTDFLPSLVEYFIPVNYNFIVEYAGYKHINIIIKLCGIVIYTLGKVLFGYGVVQVVQAFRKYNKSS